MGLRDQKREQVRADIVDATHRLIAEHGFDATTVEMIAEEAFVSSRTVYRYFPRKEDIVFAPAGDDIGDLCELVRTHCAEEVALPCLVEALVDVLADRQRQPWFVELVCLIRDEPAIEAYAAAWRAELATEVAAAIAEIEGVDEPGVDELALGAVTVAIGVTALTVWIREGADADLTTLVRRAATTVLSGYPSDGLGAAPAIDVRDRVVGNGMALASTVDELGSS